MITVALEQYGRICANFASLLSYPQGESASCFAQLDSLDLPRRARKSLDAFRIAIESLPAAEQQELYTRTFDLSPLCSPALSVHLFGVESFKRSHLMVGLLDMFREAGFESRSETADHMAAVTRFLPCARPADRQEIIQYVLAPALTQMTELLSSKQNPYAHLMEAVIATVSAIETSEVAYA